MSMNDEERIKQLLEERERALERARKLELLARQKKSQASELARKARTRRLIEHGGLIEKLLSDHFDKGILVGLIAEYQEAFKPENSGQYLDMKRKGDALIAKWEEERKRKSKTKPDREENADAGA